MDDYLDILIKPKKIKKKEKVLILFLIEKNNRAINGQKIDNT